MRYSEKLLERSGISVETLDLSELFGRAARLEANDRKLTAKVKSIAGYVSPAAEVAGVLDILERFATA